MVKTTIINTSLAKRKIILNYTVTKSLKKRMTLNYVKSVEKLIASSHLYFDSKQV
jgi:hypothetical protein